MTSHLVPIIQAMDPEQHKEVYKKVMECRNNLKVALDDFDENAKFAKTLNLDERQKKSLANIIQRRFILESLKKDCEEELIVLWQMAVMKDIDLDGSRRLALYRSIYRFHKKVEERFGCPLVFPIIFPGIMGVLMFTAIVFIFFVV